MSIRKNKIKSKIIGIIGSPGSGKSYLAEKISTALGCEAIYEVESSFPLEIIQNLRSKKNLFETIVWFRNRQIQNHEAAKLVSARGGTVVLDTTLLQHKMYIDLYIKEKFYKDTLIELGKNDMEIYSTPDIIIYISTTQSLVNKFLGRRKGQFPWEDEKWINYMSRMAKITDDFVKCHTPMLKSLIVIKRDEYDFSQQKDLDKLLSMIHKTVSI